MNKISGTELSYIKPFPFMAASFPNIRKVEMRYSVTCVNLTIVLFECHQKFLEYLKDHLTYAVVQSQY